MAVAVEAKVQFCKKAEAVICSQRGPPFYKGQRPGCEGRVQATAGHTIHVTGESIVFPNRQDSMPQPPLAERECFAEK